MVGRYAGAFLGLLAFAIVILTGLSAHNPPTVILSRAIWATAIFCVLGLVLGSVAQAVVNEHARHREEAVLGCEPATDGDGTGLGAASPADDTVPAEVSGDGAVSAGEPGIRPDAGAG